MVAIGKASEKQAAHVLINSFSGISSMGNTTVYLIYQVHNFVRNKILETDTTSRRSKKQKNKGKSAFKAKGSKKFKYKAKNQYKKVSFASQTKS